MNEQNGLECRAAFGQLVEYIRTHSSHVVDLFTLNIAFEAAEDYASKDNPKRWEVLRNSLNIAQDLALIHCQTVPLICAILMDMPSDEVKELHIRDAFETLAVYDALNAESEPSTALLQDSKHVYWAVLLWCAKAHRDLHTATDVSESVLERIHNTLIPVTQSLKMRYYTRILQDDCFSLKREEPYNHLAVVNHIRALASVGTDAYNRFDEQLSYALAAQVKFASVNEYGFCSSDGHVFRRAVPSWEVREQILLNRGFDRSVLDLWEVMLAYDGESEADMIRNYISLHRKFLNEDLTMEYVGQEASCVTFRLMDSVENNYLVKLVPKDKVYTFLFGDEASWHLDPACFLNDAKRNGTMITVYVRLEEDVKYIKKILPAGSTVLDLAFHNSPTEAVMVKAARIHQMAGETAPAFSEKDYLYPLHTVLKENDVVSFVGNGAVGESCQAPCASIDWFSSVYTEYAKRCLIEYLKEKFT